MFSTGIIYDVLKFEMGIEPIVLPRDITPQWNFKGGIFGKVFTVVGRKTETGIDIADRMIDEFEDGSVLLMQANDNSRAHFGDITAFMLQRMGCKGAILQGWTRDIEGIEELDFKIWAKGVQPQNSKDRWIVEDIQREIVIGNQFITPEDYVIADRNAVIIIKGEHIVDAVLLGGKLFTKETDLITKILKDKISAKKIKETYGQW
jgi:regulator of RNase E activity RraA